MKKLDKSVWIILLGIVLFVFGISIERKITTTRVMYRNMDKSYELTWENINFWADYYGIKNKTVMLSQVYIETGNLSSVLCLTYNNLTGMHYPSARPNASSGFIIADRGAQVAIYDYWWLSIKDYKMWQVFFGYTRDVTDSLYIKILCEHAGVGYAEDKGYKNAIDNIYGEFRDRFD